MSNRLIDIFPPDDPLARFVLAMGAAANDVDGADEDARRANDPPGTNDPDHTHRTRFTYRVRLQPGHFFEAIAALKAWRREEVEVRRLLAALSPRGQARLKLVCGVEQRVGRDVLRSVRNNSFHYPKLGTDYVRDPVEELADAIRKNPDTEAGFDVLVPTNAPPGEDPPRTRRRYRFADQMMLSIAFGGYEPDEKKARKQMDIVHQAAEEFAELVDEIFDLYCKRRGIQSSEQSD